MPAPICHINLSPNFRGGERQAELLIRGVAGWGVKQRFIGNENAQLAANLEDVKDLEIVTVSGRSQAASASKGSSIIHAHEPGALAVAHRVNFFNRIPYMLTHSAQHPPPAGYWVKRSYHKAAHVIALSKAINKTLVSYSNKLQPKVIASCASAYQTFATTVETLTRRYQGKFVVGHIGSLLDSHKGQSDLITVARQVERSHPKMLFVFVGVGPDEAQFKEQANGLSNVEFVGAVKNIGDYLKIMSVFAYPSRHEGYASTLLDAMDYSVPVITTTVGGLPEIIQDELSGLLVTSGNVDQLAFAIQRLHDDEALRARLGQGGHIKSQNFTPDVMIEQHLELYQQFFD